MAQLESLVSALSNHPLPQSEVAKLLGCSPSTARNYLTELVAVGVLNTVQHAVLHGRKYKMLYCVREEEGAMQGRHANLTVFESVSARALSARGVKLGAYRNLQRQNDYMLMALDNKQAVRDPLVSALFGK